MKKKKKNIINSILSLCWPYSFWEIHSEKKQRQGQIKANLGHWICKTIIFSIRFFFFKLKPIQTSFWLIEGTVGVNWASCSKVCVFIFFSVLFVCQHPLRVVYLCNKQLEGVRGILNSYKPLRHFSKIRQKKLQLNFPKKFAQLKIFFF